MNDADEIELRVYYEDTDLAGIVYYANYFKYIERGRTEYLRARGIDQMALKEAGGGVFAVRKVAAEYLKPAKMDDLLTVRTAIETTSGARVTMAQQVLRREELLFDATVEIVALTETGRPRRVPDLLRSAGANPG